MTVSLLVGDVRALLALIPTESVDCVVTSPPYWGLRNYGVEGQIGMEPTMAEHMRVMVDVFREVRRVLKAHGTAWVNYGDSYATTPNGKSAAEYKAEGADDRTFRDKPFSTIGGVLKSKDLCMLPNRLAIALQEDGWWVRSEIIWHKPNPMPESSYDRPTTSYEKVWLLAKGESYYFNAEACREPVTGNANRRAAKSKTGVGWGHGTDKAGRQRVRITKRKTAAPGSGIKNNSSFDAALVDVVETRHMRNVWTIQTHPFKDAHFATFPPELVERCLKAGCPPTKCAACGAPDDCGGLCAAFGRKPGVVLDPFGGAGTVGLVAEQLGMDSILIELNPKYAEITRRRLGLPTTEAA